SLPKSRNALYALGRIGRGFECLEHGTSSLCVTSQGLAPRGMCCNAKQRFQMPDCAVQQSRSHMQKTHGPHAETSLVKKVNPPYLSRWGGQFFQRQETW